MPTPRGRSRHRAANAAAYLGISTGTATIRRSTGTGPTFHNGPGHRVMDDQARLDLFIAADLGAAGRRVTRRKALTDDPQVSHGGPAHGLRFSLPPAGGSWRTGTTPDPATGIHGPLRRGDL